MRDGVADRLFELVQFRVEPMGAFGADAVGEVGVGMAGDVVLDLLPGAVVFADFFAGGADGQQAAEGFDLLEGFLQLGDQCFPLFGRLCLTTAISMADRSSLMS